MKSKCVVCGALFDAPPSSKRKTCSDECRYKLNSSPFRASLRNKLNGRIWILIDPSGNQYETENLHGWALDNYGLFFPDSADINSSAKKIRDGFASIASAMRRGKRTPRYYKGWMLKCLPEQTNILSGTSGRMSVIDITGQRFGRLVVTGMTDTRTCGDVVWHCRCDCGKEMDVAAACLRRGNTKSCGCWRRDRAKSIAPTQTGKYTGIHFSKSNGAYTIFVKRNGRKYSIGTYCNIDDAVLVRDKLNSVPDDKFEDCLADFRKERRSHRKAQNTSGVVGVTATKNGKWIARKYGKYLGKFQTIQQASEAIENYERNSNK